MQEGELALSPYADAAAYATLGAATSVDGLFAHPRTCLCAYREVVLGSHFGGTSY